MKPLPAIIALCIVYTTSGSIAAAYGPGVGSYGQDTEGYRRPPWETTDDSILNVKAQLTVDTDNQLDIYQKGGETDEVYYKRILTQHSYETYKEYSIRMEILKVLLPDLPIWNNYIFYDYWSLEYNSVEPQIKESYLATKPVTSETLENYFERLFEKHDDENVNEYIRRICVMRTRFPILSVWQGNGFIEYVKPHLTAYEKNPKATKQVNTSPASSNSFSDSRTQSSSSSPSIEVNSQSTYVASSSPGPSSNPTVPSISVAPISPNPTPNNIYQSSSPSSPSPSSNPTTATPTTSNLVSSQQITTTTSTVSSPNTLPAKSLSHRRTGKLTKYLKSKGGQYAIQEGETEERYCKRVLQTELPLPKKEYYKRAKNLKKVVKYKLRKYVTKLCKPHLLLNGQQVVLIQVPPVQPAPTNAAVPTTQNAPTMQPVSSTQQIPSYSIPGAQLSAGAQLTASV